MTPRTVALAAALRRRGYSELRPGPDYRRWRISPTHRRRITVLCARRGRWLFGDIFLLANGRLMLGATRALSVAVPQRTVDNLLSEGGGLRPTAEAMPPPPPPVTISLEELLAP